MAATLLLKCSVNDNIALINVGTDTLSTYKDPLRRFTDLLKTSKHRDLVLNHPDIFDQQRERIHPNELEDLLVEGTPVCAEVKFRLYVHPVWRSLEVLTLSKL